MIKLLSISKYTQKDINTIASKKELLTKLHSALDPTYYNPSAKADEEFKNYIEKKIHDPDFKIYVAKDENNCIGFVMGWIEFRPVIYHKRRVGYLSNIYVDERCKKRGIGKKLYLKIENWFKKKKVDFIEISADARNNEAVTSFKQYGFNELSITFYKYPNSD